jgi:two-component system response regulator AdeR
MERPSVTVPTPGTDAPLVLVVEDEAAIANVVLAYLKRDGLRSLHCADGLQALQLFDSARPDLVLLDIQLPGMDGVDVLRHIRAHSDTPVIMLTAFVDDVDKLLSLRLGADDHITKPFVPAEVVARVRAVLRRTLRARHSLAPLAAQPPLPAQAPFSAPGAVRQPPVQAAPPPGPPPLRCGALEIDTHAHCASVMDQAGTRVPLVLTLTEFRLLACLAAQPRRCFSRNSLIEHCLPESDAMDRVIDSHLSKLRSKLKQAGQGDLIETVRGIGYRLWPGS